MNEVESCMKCFKAAVPKVGIDLLQSRISCSRQYLSPHFDECTDMMEDVVKEPKKKHQNEKLIKASKCYGNVRTRNILERCFRGTKIIPPLNAVDSILCGRKPQNSLPVEPIEPIKPIKGKNNTAFPYKTNCLISSYSMNEVESCMKCFKAAVPKVGIDLLQSRISCSRQYLSPHFDECTDMMEDVVKEPKKKHQNEKLIKASKCFGDVRTRNILERCFRGTKEIPPLNAVDSILCGRKPQNSLSVEPIEPSKPIKGKKDTAFPYKTNCLIASYTEIDLHEMHIQRLNCMKCFKAAEPKVGFDLLQSRISCSRQYLSPHFSECTYMMEDAEKEPKKKYRKEVLSQISECFKRVRTRNIVERCFRGTKDVNTLNAVDAILCGRV